MLDPEAKILIHNLCPKGRKHIARGEAPGRRNIKRAVISFTLSGLIVFIHFSRGLYPLLYTDGLSGLTLKFLNIKYSQKGDINHDE
jgi:hypothetical protein